MERTAIDASGVIGSLYDGFRDCLLESLPVDTNEISSNVKDLTFCELINGDSFHDSNLLQILDIGFDLRLNVLLNVTPRTGVAALVDYPHPINKFTRFLHYTYEHRFEELRDTATGLTDFLKSPKPKAKGTYIITGVSWGIHAVVVLQLPCVFAENSALDTALKNVQAVLKDSQNAEPICPRDVELLNQIVHTTVYSNVRDMENMPTLLAMCQYINGRNEQYHAYRPIKYTLKDIQYFYPQTIGSDLNTIPSLSKKLNNFELQLIRLLKKVTGLEHSIFDAVPQLLCGHLQDRLRELQQQWEIFKDLHQKQIKKIEKLLSDVRLGLADSTAIDQASALLEKKSLNDSIRSLTADMDKLEGKGQLITSLQKEGFAYCNVAEFNLNKISYAQVLVQKLMPTNRNTRILCSNDTLDRTRESQLNQLHGKMCQEKKINPHLHLIYADFSYCSFELANIVLLPSNNEYTDKFISSTTAEDVVNVLILGETGVGKSTFINAFVNYLTFDTLTQAENNQPVVLIPVSFLITTGETFEERVVQFGQSHKPTTEHFDHPGQSVTQHCKSYLFDLNRIHRKKLRIIDTPGFGDTRGLDQDDKNMQHILQYVRTLTHLNAVCFLLKSNTSRLHIFFRSCLTQLLDLLGPNAHEHLLFCFTNARSTFYTPGDTAPLLRTMLSSLQMQRPISLKKENTFCFDNESFRYLVARQNGIEFDSAQRHEYETSWSTSVKESARLLSCVTEQLSVYQLPRKQQSKKHAAGKITEMVRPILEALRNILRNLVLYDRNDKNRSIELRPKAIPLLFRKDSPSRAYPVTVGSFLVFRETLVENPDLYRQRSLSPNRDSLFEYTLDYEYLNKPSRYTRDQMDQIIQLFRKASNLFSYFLMNIAYSMETDPFLMGLQKMIDEETYLSQSKTSNNLNEALVAQLRELKSVYEQRMGQLDFLQICDSLPALYEWIQKVSTHAEIREQLAAIYESRCVLIKEDEYWLPNFT